MQSPTLIAVIVLTAAAPALAQNQYYVSTSGSDSNNGTSPSTPWRHLYHAIASFNLGATGAVINVHAGTYDDGNTSCVGYGSALCINRGGSSPTVRLKIVCDAAWSVPSGAGCLLRNSSGGTNLITIAANNVDVGALGQHGFDLSKTDRADAIDTPCEGLPHISTGTCTSGNSVHILGNYIHDMSQVIPCLVNPNGNPAITFNNNHGAKMDDGQVIGNRITNIGPQSESKLNGGPGCWNNYGMYISTSSVRVENNVLANIAGFGVHYYSAACSGVITNNTIVRTEFPNIIYGGGDCANGVAEGSGNISNNILGETSAGQPNIQVGVPGGGGAACSSAHPNLVSSNVFNGGAGGQVGFNTTSSACTTVANSHSEAPTTTFVHYTGGNNDDFHLKAGSIAVGGGTVSCASGGLTPCTPGSDFDEAAESPMPIGAFVGAAAHSSPAPPTGLVATVR